MANAFMTSSGQQASSSPGQLVGPPSLRGLTATGGLGYPGQVITTTNSPASYSWPVPYMPADELIESQKWIYVRKSPDHGKKQGETAGIILVDTDGNHKRITMEELAVIAGWEW